MNRETRLRSCLQSKFSACVQSAGGGVMKVSNLTIAALLVFTFISVPTVFGQSDRGGITGRVTDQAGAVVADAKVTALNVETGETREARTNGEGNFTIP